MGRIDRIINYFFYRSERVGKDGKRFTLWKFRTMVHGAEKIGPFSVARSDIRVTRIGRFLRRTHLDEIPNLINVLKGEMSLIGPRPDVPHYADRIPEPDRTIILSVKPGCVDPATLWNFNEGAKLDGQEDPEKYYEEEIWPEKLLRQKTFVLRFLNRRFMSKCTESEFSKLP